MYAPHVWQYSQISSSKSMDESEGEESEDINTTEAYGRMAKGNPKVKPFKSKIGGKSMSRKLLGELDENIKGEIIAIATASLMTWDMLDDEEKAKYSGIEEFTGYMVLGTAHDIVHEDDEEEEDE